MSDSLNFFNTLRPKILELISRETADCLRMAPYVVSVAPNPSTGLVGVTRASAIWDRGINRAEASLPPLIRGEGGTPQGWRGASNFPAGADQSPVIYVKYHSALSSATTGTAVLLVYRGNLSNAYALPTF